jgi:hypothetical protein
LAIEESEIKTGPSPRDRFLRWTSSRTIRSWCSITITPVPRSVTD